MSAKLDLVDTLKVMRGFLIPIPLLIRHNSADMAFTAADFIAGNRG